MTHDLEKRNHDIARLQHELDEGNVSRERKLNIEASLKYLSKRSSSLFRPRLRKRSVSNGDGGSAA